MVRGEGGHQRRRRPDGRSEAELLRLPGRRSPIQVFRVVGRADSDRKGLVVYLLKGEQQMALRLPKRSRAVATLDELADEDGPASSAP